MWTSAPLAERGSRCDVAGLGGRKLRLRPGRVELLVAFLDAAERDLEVARGCGHPPYVAD